MDKNALKRKIEDLILNNNTDERSCQSYESILNELDKKYDINIASKLSPINTPIIMISLKSKRNRPSIFLTVGKNGIMLKFVCRVYIGVPLNRLNSLIDDCYYNKNNSKLAYEYYEENMQFFA